LSVDFLDLLSNPQPNLQYNIGQYDENDIGSKSSCRGCYAIHFKEHKRTDTEIIIKISKNCKRMIHIEGPVK